MTYFSVIFLLPVGSEVFVSVFVREVVFIREDSIEGGEPPLAGDICLCMGV